MEHKIADKHEKLCTTYIVQNALHFNQFRIKFKISEIPSNREYTFNFINTFIQKWTPAKKFGAYQFADKANKPRKKLRKAK